MVKKATTSRQEKGENLQVHVASKLLVNISLVKYLNRLANWSYRAFPISGFGKLGQISGKRMVREFKKVQPGRQINIRSPYLGRRALATEGESIGTLMRVQEKKRFVTYGV
jgi:hypothetical protein